MRFVLLLCFLVYLFPHFSSYIIVITNSFGICSLSLSLSTFSRYFLPLSLSNKQNMDHHSLTHSRSLSLSFTLITLFIDAWLCGIKTKTMRRKNTFSSVPFLFSPRPFVFLFFLFIFSYFLVTIVGFAAPAIPIWRYLFHFVSFISFLLPARGVCVLKAASCYRNNIDYRWQIIRWSTTDRYRYRFSLLHTLKVQRHSAAEPSDLSMFGFSHDSI